MNLTLLLILTISIALLSFTNSKLLSENRNLREKIGKMDSDLSKFKSDKEEITSIDPGDRAIIPDYGLRNDTGPFSVTYEVEIVEVSLDRVKVKAIDFTSTDKEGKDPKNKTGIINFMQDKWIPKKNIELVIHDSIRRDIKLKKLLEE